MEIYPHHTHIAINTTNMNDYGPFPIVLDFGNDGVAIVASQNK